MEDNKNLHHASHRRKAPEFKAVTTQGEINSLTIKEAG